MNLVYLAIDRVARVAFKKSHIPVKPFVSLDAYAREPVSPLGFIVDTTDKRKGTAVLKALRKAPRTAAKPIFLARSLGDIGDHFSDGVITTIDEAYDRARSIHQLISELVPEIFSSSENDVYRLLGFLYSRPDTRLVPVKHWRFEKVYEFPLVQTMLNPTHGTDQWLTNLQNRKLLRHAALIDRLRHCPKCDGAHLNYVDICPNCTDLNISRKPFFHCFTCGRIAPEKSFMHRGSLVCPGCSTRLRHIGTDYDRPLENYVCHACDHTFIDPEVVAHCQHCDTKSKPDELVPKPVYSLEITERGRMAARSGSLSDVCQLPDRPNNLETSRFEFIVDWLLSLCQRDPNERFSLIGIRLRNIIELTDKIGKYRMSELMDGFISRIRIDSTDLVTRTGQYNFWFLLPRTDADGCTAVLNRLADVKTHTRQDEDITLEFDAVTYSAPRDIQTDETARSLMARIEGEMG
ncbi:MAG: hypothetical protein DSY89_09500 [Deltaproteobacteria bacterium]|nr:MAG: hypothetical protein DSY89_09500 [Deltaproteobacteria bacterium]